jgi:selenocysteine-specific elongation factor
MATRVAHAIIGAAGHIDHGKTALVRALTGQETDRLKEERERGISIDLGFAWFELPGGARAGVIDVPGHERFIRNMLAGAHGIDLALFTVAADDGVMPQSEEHLDILHLLGLKRGIFVITKTDLADRKRLDEVRAEIELLAEGTALAGAPITEVSALTGAGIEELRAEIVRLLDGFEARRPTGLFRLPVDRAFVIKGHGTVVTGTAMGAEAQVGQRMRVLPANAEARVRAIQVHGEAVERAGVCQRVALNLAGVERVELKRGDVVADERLDFATTRLDARIEIRPAAKRPLRNQQRVRFYLGAAETPARAIVLEAPGEIPPKKSAFAQLVLDHPMVALAGDRFVLRDETNVRTIGGGVVLNPLGRRLRKPLDGYVRNLAALAGGFGADAVAAMLELRGELAAPAARLAILFNVPEPDVRAALGDARFVRLTLGDEEGFTTAARWDELKRFAASALAEHHRANPLAPGMEMEAMRERMPYEIAPRAFRALLDRLCRETGIVREESILRLPSHRVQLGGDAGQMGERIERILSDARFQPPDLAQLAAALGALGANQARLRAVLAAMEREGRIVKVAADLYFARAAVDAARELMARRIAADGQITAAVFRDLLGASRKFSIALLDYFDRSGVTLRVGDVRKLRAAH